MHQVENILQLIQKEIIAQDVNSQAVCAKLLQMFSGGELDTTLRSRLLTTYPILAGIFLQPEYVLRTFFKNMHGSIIDRDFNEELQAFLLLWLRDIADGVEYSMKAVTVAGASEPVKKTTSIMEQFVPTNNLASLKLAILRKQLSINWWSDFVNNDSLSYNTIKARNILLGQLQFSLDNLRYALLDPALRTIDIKKWSDKAYQLLLELLDAVEQSLMIDSYVELKAFCYTLKEELETIRNKYQDVTLYLH